MRYAVILFCTTLLLFSQVIVAQYYETGQDPASLKWMQIKTGRFTVIYPEKYDSGGIAFAKSLEEAYSKLASLYPERKFKIPVVIHNYSTQSNGYVAWAPRRMEIYPTPEQNTIPLDMKSQLAQHELTHVLQMESLNKGFSKAMSLILGEQYTGAIASLLPLWFLEGDAVFAESALTESGRGRTPSFQKQLKAITVEKGGMYKYDKILNGSYRDFIPSYYQSGYQMVTWALAKYNPQIWNRALDFTGKQPFTLNPVNISLLRSAGLTKKRLFNETFDSLKTIWTKDVSIDNVTSYEAINPDKHGKYINYYSPVFAGTDSIIAIKTTLSKPPAFVLINPSEKSEKRIHLPGQMFPWFISYGNGKIVWVETQYDARWENRNYSVIKMMDIRRNKTTRLSRRSRYLSAAVSPDGKKIAAIENTISNINNIVFIEVKSGDVLQTIASPGNAHLQHPQWAEEGDKITVISLTEAGEGIISYKLASREWEILVETGREDLQSAFLRNDSLFFISSLSGTDNIYLRAPDGKVTGMTRSGFGTIDLSLNGEKALFSDYTSLGNNICITKLTGAAGTVNDNVSSASFLINRFDIKPQSPDNVAGTLYTPEPYRKWQHLFRFHSWMPFYADIEKVQNDPASVRPGLSLMSQNTLGTLISSVGYEYSADRRNKFHSHITWKGWYPVLESQLDYGDQPVVTRPNTSVAVPSDLKEGLKFTNSVSIPLIFSSGRFTQYLYPSFSAEYSNRYIYVNNNYDYGQTQLTSRLNFSNYQRSAIRDIYPRWAQVVDLSYTFAPFDKLIYGTESTLKTAFYFPGFLPNNGIKIRFEKEIQSPTSINLIMGRRISIPRSYTMFASKDIYFGSVDYVMPLFCPDFNISSLLYLKRIRTGLFYDYAKGTGNYFFEPVTDAVGVVTYKLNYHNNQEIFKSFGFELMADFHVLRIPFMISGGVQAAWKKISESPSFEILFNIDLFGMSLGRSPM